jgi:2-phospho-L-lactate guanylyltransferase (CobY/MobA/RfbA family)
MTTVAVLCDPPRPGLVLPELVETSPLSPDEAADLYAAMLRDVVGAVAGSGAELLVNYRPDDALPDTHRTGADAEAEVRETVADALDGDARLEVQVGETFAGRVGNTVTHLLDREGVRTAAVVEPTGAFLTRGEVDNAAMKLRRSEVVLGPGTGGRVYYAGFAATVDFGDAYTAPAVETLTDRGLDAGHEVDFLPQLPVVETGSDLAAALALLRARRRASRPVPDETTDCLDDLGVEVVADGDGLSLVR